MMPALCSSPFSLGWLRLRALKWQYTVFEIGSVAMPVLRTRFWLSWTLPMPLTPCQGKRCSALPAPISPPWLGG